MNNGTKQRRGRSRKHRTIVTGILFASTLYLSVRTAKLHSTLIGDNTVTHQEANMIAPSIRTNKNSTIAEINSANTNHDEAKEEAIDELMGNVGTSTAEREKVTDTHGRGRGENTNKKTKVNDVKNVGHPPSTIYYPRPRPYDVFVDCGCPYTCKESHLDMKMNNNTNSCRDEVTMRMEKWLHGEEFACSLAASEKKYFCPNECNPEKCKKPPLEDVSIEKLQPFTRHEGVAIVSKIMGYPVEVNMLLQALCLMTAAYNDRLNYDIVVFSTIEQSIEVKEKFEKVLHPARFTFVHENVTVPKLVSTMSETRRNYLMDQCNHTSVNNFTWDDNCPGVGKLRYNWQAEFRSYHLYNRSELKKYKYMLWMDADAFCTRPWTHDPVDFVIKNKLTMAFDNTFGRGGGPSLQKKIREQFNTTICYTGVDQKTGDLYAKTGNSCNRTEFKLIHGMFHVSNLDVFRSSLAWLKDFIGEDRLSRNPDDQEAVTVTSLMMSPGKVKDLEISGLKMNIMHNGMVEGKYKVSRDQFMRWWESSSKRDFQAAHDQCEPFIFSGG